MEDRRPDCPLHPGTKLNAFSTALGVASLFTHADGTTHGDNFEHLTVPWAQVKERKRYADELAGRDMDEARRVARQITADYILAEEEGEDL
jgi:hypothetical protein